MPARLVPDRQRLWPFAFEFARAFAGFMDDLQHLPLDALTWMRSWQGEQLGGEE